MEKLRVELGTNSYDIHIGPGLLAQTGQILKETGFSDKLVIVTDTTVGSLYGNTLKQGLLSNGFDVLTIEIPGGEEQKSLETAGSLYQQLTDFYAERTTPVLALGGGVIGDLAGIQEFVRANLQAG